MDVGTILIWLLAGALVAVSLWRGGATLSVGFEGSWRAVVDLLPPLSSRPWPG